MNSDENLADYPPAPAGACILFSGGVESTYISLMYPDSPRLTIETAADVHPRGGEMFIEARRRGFSEVLYGGNEKNWGERDDGCMFDRRSGTWILTDGFEYTQEFRDLWREYLGVRIVCPIGHLYKDEVIQKIYESNKEAYYSLQCCYFNEQGWCGYCDKCLVTGAIIDALGYPKLFEMKSSVYSEEIERDLKTYCTGDYDPYWKLPVFRRLQEKFGYSFKI